MRFRGPYRSWAASTLDITDVAVIGLPNPERGERVCVVAKQPPGDRPLVLEAGSVYLRETGLAPHKLSERV